MNIQIYLYLTIACKIVTANNWTINNEGDCFYTVISTNPLEILTDEIHMCDYVEPYITMIITNSTRNHVTSEFLNTTFNSWVMLLKASDNTWLNINSSAFSNFKNVRYIDLSGNHIKNMNMSFKGLEVLDFLNLSRNHIAVINSDTFTTSENETRLRLLDLSCNSLTHLSEDLFVKISTLRILYLQENKLSVLNDESFKHLKNLIYLNLCCNKITELNTTMMYLPSLIELNLSNNNILIVYEYSLTGLVSLETIDLSHNKIINLPLNFLKESTSLTKIDLSFNPMNVHPQVIRISVQNCDEELYEYT